VKKTILIDFLSLRTKIYQNLRRKQISILRPSLETKNIFNLLKYTLLVQK